VLAITRGFFVILLLGSSVSAQNSRSLQQRIPNPDPQKYRSIRDGQDWHNPKLVVRPGGIDIIGITRLGQPIPVQSVPKKLEELPDSAWPFGLIVMVSDACILASPNDTPRIQANRSRLLKVLKEHGIAVDPWPC
jgi:hypothetical protein